MITITIGKCHDEIIIRGKVSWMEEGLGDDNLLDLINQFARDAASRHGWIVDSKTQLYEYRERIARAD